MNTALARRKAAESAGLGGLELVCDLSGALWLPEERTLVVADLHLEKGSSLARRGALLPPYDSAATLAVLAAAIARRRPRRVVALGDSFHEPEAERRLAPADAAALATLQMGREWIWIAGNHDPAPPRDLGGEAAAEVAIGAATLRHEPDPRAGGAEIAGHLHPAAKVMTRAGALRRRCFALSATRCVLPALGAYAGGLNLRDRAFAPLFPAGVSARVLGADRVYAIDGRLLLPD